MSSVTTMLGPRRFRYDLAGRDRDFRWFPLPGEIVRNCHVASGTKRRVEICLSTKRVLRGFITVSSGTELYIPRELQLCFREAEWFDCEIVGAETADHPSLALRVS